MRSLALEVANYGVTANTLALGLMGTPQIAASIPLGRTGTPEDVAAACVWLVSMSWVGYGPDDPAERRPFHNLRLSGSRRWPGRQQLGPVTSPDGSVGFTGTLFDRRDPSRLAERW